jgi:hypothetical protein
LDKEIKIAAERNKKLEMRNKIPFYQKEKDKYHDFEGLAVYDSSSDSNTSKTRPLKPFNNQT